MQHDTTDDGRTNRRTYLKVLGAGALAAGVAGCLGAGAGGGSNGDGPVSGDSDGRSGKTGGSADTEADSLPSQSAGGADTSDGQSSSKGKERALTLYRFEQPETYTFETHDLTFQKPGRLVVDVTEVTEKGVATVDLHYEVAGQTFDDTVTGLVADGDFEFGLKMSSAGGAMFSYASMPVLLYYATHDEITVGDVWKSLPSGPAVRIEILGTDTYAGVKGYTFTSSLVGGKDGTKQYMEGCMAPDIQMIPHALATDANGEVPFEMTLVSYERK